MQVNGFEWPERDVHCRQVVFDRTKDMELALDLCKGRSIAVQAGGNAGVWPTWLANRFQTVYTFEPDAENFRCLAINCPDNVIKLQSAVGYVRQCIDLHRDPVNCGAYYVESVGNIPVLRIDDLELPGCDLMVLDVEGMEMDAIQGAMLTIQENHPVIMYEDKGLSEKYGVGRGDIERRMAEFGYKVVHRIKRDVILA